MGWFDLEYKTEAIKTLITRKKFEDALELADDTNWKRVKDVKLICSVSDLYKMAKRYEESRDLLLEAYKRKPEDKTIVAALCESYIRTGEFADAEDCLNEYIELAPEDETCLMLKYKLLSANKGDIMERIALLEDLTIRKISAKWFYELAKLYYAAGMPDKCKRQCEEIFQLFGESKYAAKAMELKKKVG